MFEGTGWNGDKVPWVVANRYRGPILIGGARIDVAGELTFSSGYLKPNVPIAAIQIAPRASKPNGTGILRDGHRSLGSLLWVKSRGCYAVQIDGSDFSIDVVVEAVETSPATP